MRIPAGKSFLAAALIFFLCPYHIRAQEAINSSDLHLSSLIESVKPSIVAVGIYYFNDIPKIRYMGTGFAVSDGKKIITNHHVVQGIIKEKKTAYLRIFHKSFKSTGIKARIVKVDEFHDLAVLEHEGKALAPLPVGSDQPIKEGYRVIFTGYPVGLVLGLNPTTHQGIISNIAPLVKPSPTAGIIDGEIIRHLDNPYEVFQIDAVALPGNSGSPVMLLSTGEVVGVVNQVFVKGIKEHALTDPSGITYAIPAEFIGDLID